MELNLLHPQAFEKREQLDWSVFLEKIKSFCNFSHNLDYFDSPQLYTNKQSLIKHHKLIDNMTKYLVESSSEIFKSPALSRLNKDQLLRLEKNAGLNLNEINIITTLVENFDSLIRSGFLDDIFEYHFEAPIKFNELMKLSKYIRRYVSSSGKIITDHDPILKNQVEKVFELENKVRSELQKILGDESWDNKLQNKGIDLINDHYVLTLRSDSYRSDLGDIISHSQTGASLYIEPHCVRDYSSKVLLAKRELEKLIQRITYDISSKLYALIDTIKNIHEVSLHIDR